MKQKLVFIKYALYFLVCLELFFWIGGWVTQTTQVWMNARLAGGKDSYKVLCIGESTTLVGGQDSYPSKLEKILNQKLGHKKVQVINQGMAGTNTTGILKEMPGWLRTYQPDMVVAMIGILDPIEDGSPKTGPSLDFLKEIKTYQLFTQLKKKAGAALSSYAQRQRKQFAFLFPASRPTESVKTPEKEPVFVTEYEMFTTAMNKAPEGLRNLYMLIHLAEGNGRVDVADTLYQGFLKENRDPVINRWVSKQYGNFLEKSKQYDKFVARMRDVPYEAWSFDWIKGYCHGDANLERVKTTIESMVQDDGVSPLVYGYLVSCYQEAGREDLAQAYLGKLGGESSYFSPGTRSNYRKLKELLLANNVQPVFAQYPMRDLRTLQTIFEGDEDRDRIIFVDNGTSFQEAVRASSYETYFTDRASGDTGHATVKGNELLASNVAEAILKHLR